MNLADVLAEETKNSRPRGCQVEKVLKVLGPKDAQALQEYLAAESADRAAISRALKTMDHIVSPKAISAHIRGECSCRKK